MDPQCGYYQYPQQTKFNNRQVGQSGRGYQGSASYGSYGTGSPNYNGWNQAGCGDVPTPFGGTSTRCRPLTQGRCTTRRPPPVFNSCTMPINLASGPGRNSPRPSQSYTGRYQQQQRAQGICQSFQSDRNLNQYQSMYQQQQQQAAQQSSQQPPSYCTPQAIKVNVTAEQLQNAKNTSMFQDRAEPCVEGNSGVKYVQLDWKDLLGGMENLRVSMVPSADPCNQNRQLKVSFGGQRTDPPQAGETPLKVISMQPAGTTDRMELRDENAYAGTMKVCNPPTNTRMTPSFVTTRPQSSSMYSARGNYGKTGGSVYNGSCR